MWRNPQEYFTYEFILTSPTVCRLSGLSNFLWWVAGGRWQFSGVLPPGLFQYRSIAVTHIYIYIWGGRWGVKLIVCTLLFLNIFAYGLPKETVAAITILYRNTKVKVRSPDGDTEYLDIVAGVLQGDTLAPYLFIICLDYVLRTSGDKIRENGFELTKKRSRRYPAKTITDADYAGDIA